MRTDEPRQTALDGLATDGDEGLSALEALIFVTGDSVELRDIASALQWSLKDVERQVERLTESLQRERRGIILQRHGNSVQLVSAPRFGPLVERFLSVERKTRLSEAALETLAILAYRQPATRAEVEAIRGVDCSGVLATLVAREMVEVIGRRAVIGNPLEYATTDVFLRQFGIASLDELSPGGDN